MQKLFRLLMIAATIVLGAFWFVHWSKTRALNSGEVHVRPQPYATATQPHSPQEMASDAKDASLGDPSKGQSPKGAAPLPAPETFRRNAPNGIVATGSGKFQLYRQGDMTFRLNTETGEACVLFATDAQWRKPLVYEHGCGSH